MMCFIYTGGAVGSRNADLKFQWMTQADSEVAFWNLQKIKKICYWGSILVKKNLTKELGYPLVVSMTVTENHGWRDLPYRCSSKTPFMKHIINMILLNKENWEIIW